jgi:hypothetical protein
MARLAEENRDWGYDRIAGALANLGYRVCHQTVGNVLQRHGLPPAPERKRTTTWSAFIRTHLALLAGTDFFTVVPLRADDFPKADNCSVVIFGLDSDDFLLGLVRFTNEGVPDHIVRAEMITHPLRNALVRFVGVARAEAARDADHIPIAFFRDSENQRRKPAFYFVAHDALGSLMDVGEAVRAIEQNTANADSRELVYVSHSIREAMMGALEKAHPRRYVMCSSVVDSKRRHAPVPEASESAAPSAAIEIGGPGVPSRLDEHDAATRAAERIARMRGL